MELARKLAREMDAHRTFSVSRVYVPNEYSVWLSPEDRERYEGVEHEVIDELAAYLLEHARREELILASSPVDHFHTDERLALGEFGIQARLVRPEVHSGQDEPRIEQDEHGQTMIYSTSARVGGPVEEAQARRPAAARAARRRRAPHAGAAAAAARSGAAATATSCSRTPASRAATRSCTAPATAWTIEDLGSTNGVVVNGEALHGAQPLRAATGSSSGPPRSSSKLDDDAPAGIRRAQVRLPRRALPVPAVGRAQRPARPAPTRAAARERGWRRRRPRPMRPACTRPRRSRARTSPTRAPRLVVERAPGHEPGMIYDLDGEVVMGRGDRAEIRLRGPVRLLAPRPHLRPGQHPRDRGPRLDQRHLPQRGAAGDAAAAARRRSRAHRRQRIRLRGGLVARPAQPLAPGSADTALPAVFPPRLPTHRTAH